MKYFPFILIPLLFPSFSAGLTPMDFSKGFPLHFEPGTPLQRVELTEDVYASGLRRDLGDIRIFNGEGHAVPMHLRRVAETPVSVSDEKQIFLPVFSIPTDAPGGQIDDDYRMKIQTSETGTILSVERRKKDAETEFFLVIDATGADTPLNLLHIDLKAASPRFLSILVEGSDDLFAWHPAGKGVLARMAHENGAIVKDRISLGSGAWKYYRLTGDGDLSMIGDIFGISGEKIVSFEPLYQWRILHGNTVENGVSEYHLPAALPVSHMDLAGEENTILGVTILSPYGENGWRAVQSGSLFNLKMGDTRIKSDPLPISGLTNHFRIAVKGAPAPLRVGWIPHEIIFMPKGPEPFRLVVGNVAVASEDLLAPILSGIDQRQIGRAFLGQEETLAGSKPAVLPKPPADYKKIILWGILGLGVLLLAGMAWSLVKKSRSVSS